MKVARKVDSAARLTRSRTRSSFGRTRGARQPTLSRSDTTSRRRSSSRSARGGNSTSRGRPGRTETRGRQLLQHICSKGGHQLKKEYKRCQTIRLIKKIIRAIESNRMTAKLLKMFDWSNNTTRELWAKMGKIYSENIEEFNWKAETFSGPVTDGKSRSYRNRPLYNRERSFNNSFCRTFFSLPSMRSFLQLFAELCYGEEDLKSPGVLCARFEEYCCKARVHSKSCTKAWRKVKEYVAKVMLEELEPFDEGVTASKSCFLTGITDLYNSYPYNGDASSSIDLNDWI